MIVVDRQRWRIKAGLCPCDGVVGGSLAGRGGRWIKGAGRRNFFYIHAVFERRVGRKKHSDPIKNHDERVLKKQANKTLSRPI
ncbi:hypothetical protein GR157_02345 [Burkholderia sp. 4701]|nr:hypothetical protein [Burkholderia sp. 4701]MXN81098.1 hypothetical protein [Burkholderia sp. 4812]